MSFPAEGLETLYRNDIEEVARLIEKRHTQNYLVFNLSGRGYNYAKFNHRVLLWEYLYYLGHRIRLAGPPLPAHPHALPHLLPDPPVPPA